MIVLAVLSYSMDEIMKMYGGGFSFQIHWEVTSNFEFWDEPRKLRLLITSQWIWIEKNPTVHLHYFIHTVRQNCQNNHFLLLLERFLISFFKILNLKNLWYDGVTWLLSTNFMKDRQGECFGKISNPYRVWKVYKHMFSENSKLPTGRTLRQDPLDLSFWSYLTFLHRCIAEVERHLLWKVNKKIQRKSCKCATEVARLH